MDLLESARNDNAHHFGVGVQDLEGMRGVPGDRPVVSLHQQPALLLSGVPLSIDQSYKSSQPPSPGLLPWVVPCRCVESIINDCGTVEPELRPGVKVSPQAADPRCRQ